MLPFRPRPISTMQPYVQEPRKRSPSIFVRTPSSEGWQRRPSSSPESVRPPHCSAWCHCLTDGCMQPTSPLQSPSSSRPGSRDRPSSPSDVHTAVSKLLALVKQLQDVLQLWGQGQAQEEQVSDAFVLVGQQFNTTVNVLWRHRVDMRSASFLFVVAGSGAATGRASYVKRRKWLAAASHPLETAVFIGLVIDASSPPEARMGASSPAH